MTNRNKVKNKIYKCQILINLINNFNQFKIKTMILDSNSKDKNNFYLNQLMQVNLLL
jgi:hypothetical protein